MNMHTSRLDLVPATTPTLEAAIAGNDALGRALGVRVPATWPPEFLDADALRYTCDRYRENPAHADWWMYFVVLRDEETEPVLVGAVGYKGPPTPEGIVEIGYGVASEYRRRGLASEASAALVARAFGYPEVRLVLAETLPELVGSIGVMEKIGLRHAGEGSEPGVIRYALTREAYEASDL